MKMKKDMPCDAALNKQHYQLAILQPEMGLVKVTWKLHYLETPVQLNKTPRNDFTIIYNNIKILKKHWKNNRSGDKLITRS